MSSSKGKSTKKFSAKKQSNKGREHNPEYVLMLRYGPDTNHLQWCKKMEGVGNLKYGSFAGEVSSLVRGSCYNQGLFSATNFRHHLVNADEVKVPDVHFLLYCTGHTPRELNHDMLDGQSWRDQISIF